MSTASNGRYGDPVWGAAPGSNGPAWSGGPWSGGPGSGGPPWHLPFGGRPLWIALTILSFFVWWPLGLAVLFYLIGSGRVGCRGRWAREGFPRHNGDRGNWSGPWMGWRSFCGGQQAQSSGNRAFDEYRADTLRRLEDEQREFTAFLDRLRAARDKSEFDAFMAERRQRPGPVTEPTAEPPAG